MRSFVGRCGLGAHPLRSWRSCDFAIYFAGAAVADTAPLTAGLAVRDELRVEGHVEAVGASRVQGVNDHRDDREAHALDVGGLGADQGRSQPR